MKQTSFILILLLSAFSFAQQTDAIDFLSADIRISIDPLSQEVKGEVIYSYRILKALDSIHIDAKKFSKVEVSNMQGVLVYHYNGNRISIQNEYKPSDFIHTLKIDWNVKPKKAMYFVGWNNQAPNQIWTQGQGKYTSNWLPSFDDVNEKVEFDLAITFDKDYEVIANGILIDKQVGNTTTFWHYDMQQPMSSYLVALAIGRYDKEIEFSKSGIPLEMYYYPEDSMKVEPTYRYSKQMFDFLEGEIGVNYPWQNYKQVPVHDFLYSGMENTSVTIFSDAFVIDEIGFVDNNYVNVNAHELAHQWFGDLVTAKSSEHHWLQEGFATYYALLAERDVFGDRYYYWRLYEYAQELLMQDVAKEGTSLLNPKSSSTTFYKRGAWTLFVLREKVGDIAFKTAVKTYLQKHQYKNVETNDFIIEVERASNVDLSEFVSTWLADETFPFNKAMEALKRNSVFIHEYLMVDCAVMNSKCDYYLISGISDQAKAKVISQIPRRITSEVFKSSIKVRQAIATSLTKIPPSLKKNYESLLNDDSYITIETALYNLWTNFEEDRIKYLDQTKNVIGLNDNNVKLLWLVLALSTPNYEETSKEAFYNELVSYTSSKYNFQLRLNAFQYLKLIRSCKEECQKNLKEATTHYNWRLVKFAKEELKRINIKRE